VPIGGDRSVGFDRDQARRYGSIVAAGVAKRERLVRLCTNPPETAQKIINDRGRDVQRCNPVPNLADDRQRVVVDIAKVADYVDPGREVADISLPGANPPFDVVRAEQIEWVEPSTGELIDEERTCGTW